ncbi:hypothetical protein OKC48_07490 [Methylorubrum extorquens]|uniref:hypothetical protein n=1 Tax=Methylorubrum extorquens TaxID=408 RepID=UPI0022374C7D|nr:hypothetical protein [Methylorubrum extorquens]UYW28349.1 hypothetical protein OKC48_07490 [Methylorubrum extorquens]
MTGGRLIPWHEYVRVRPAMAGCPSNGVLGLRVEWDGHGEIVRICGVLGGPVREHVLFDRTADPAILTSSEIDAVVRAAVLALGDTA